MVALLSGCAPWDEAKARAACETAHPNDKAKADECYAANKLAYDKAWFGLQKTLAR